MGKAMPYDKYIKLWLKGEVDGNRGVNHIDVSLNVRRYLFHRAGNRCELCGWGELNPHTDKIPLEIHHIDGNFLNSSEKNLQLLCPNCHSLTDNYRARNKSGLAQKVDKKSAH